MKCGLFPIARVDEAWIILHEADSSDLVSDLPGTDRLLDEHRTVPQSALLYLSADKPEKIDYTGRARVTGGPATIFRALA